MTRRLPLMIGRVRLQQYQIVTGSRIDNGIPTTSLARQVLKLDCVTKLNTAQWQKVSGALKFTVFFINKITKVCSRGGAPVIGLAALRALDAGGRLDWDLHCSLKVFLAVELEPDLESRPSSDR